MSLPIEVINKVFLRLSNTYGSAWDSLWALNDIHEVKELWADQLGFFHEKWDCFRWAFENLPERPPNLIQFKKLLMECPKLRTETQVYLPPPDVPPMPDEIRKKINELRKILTSHKYQR